MTCPDDAGVCSHEDCCIHDVCSWCGWCDCFTANPARNSTGMPISHEEWHGGLRGQS